MLNWTNKSTIWIFSNMTFGISVETLCLFPLTILEHPFKPAQGVANLHSSAMPSSYPSFYEIKFTVMNMKETTFIAGISMCTFNIIMQSKFIYVI